MPLVQGRKRRADPDEDASPDTSPEPATQRRRTQHEANSDEEGYAGDVGATQADGNTNVMVKKLVRLALACEYQRRPIRRADVSDKVLGNAGRQFKKVFEQAQIELRTVFGMEMVELPAREKVTLAQKRAAQKSQSQNKSTASWVLRSNLPSEFRDPEIIPPPSIPTSTEESRYVALYTTLISVIALSGGSLPRAKFERMLRRTNLEDSTPVDGFEKTEKLLLRMQREGYLVKVKEDNNGEEDVDWYVGPRGKVEVGDDGVKGFAKAVYGESSEAAEEELDRKIARSLGVGERPIDRSQAQQNGAAPTKRGRKKKNELEQEENEEDDGSSDEDN